MPKQDFYYRLPVATHFTSRSAPWLKFKAGKRRGIGLAHSNMVTSVKTPDAFTCDSRGDREVRLWKAMTSADYRAIKVPRNALLMARQESTVNSTPRQGEAVTRT